MYTKDITFLLRLLSTSKQSGLLFVEPVDQHEATWQGQFHLDKGVVVSCLVRAKADGRVALINDEALHWLVGQGRLNWHLEENVPLQTPGVPLLPPHEEASRDQRPAGSAQHASARQHQMGSIPKRTQRGETMTAQAFASREHWQVFALVDGRRTIEEIIRLLHKPPAAVMQVLQELHAAGLIA